MPTRDLMFLAIAAGGWFGFILLAIRLRRLHRKAREAQSLNELIGRGLRGGMDRETENVHLYGTPYGPETVMVQIHDETTRTLTASDMLAAAEKPFPEPPRPGPEPRFRVMGNPTREGPFRAKFHEALGAPYSGVRVDPSTETGRALERMLPLNPGPDG